MSPMLQYNRTFTCLKGFRNLLSTSGDPGKGICGSTRSPPKGMCRTAIWSAESDSNRYNSDSSRISVDPRQFLAGVVLFMVVVGKQCYIFAYCGLMEIPT